VEANFGETFPGAGWPAKPTTIATNGTTTLAEVEAGAPQVGDVFELNPAGGGSGPLLELNGGVVTRGQFPAGWMPVGAKQTGNGYEVAFSAPVPGQPGQNQYTVWNTDSSGDYTSNATRVVTGGSPTIEGVEAYFGETFLGAGSPAAPTLIGTNGQLEQVGNLFELNLGGGGTGQLLELNGRPVTAGQFPAGWTPVGAVQTETGYEVAWSILGQNEYTVWNTDSGGDYTSDATGVLSSTNPTQAQELKGLETYLGENFAGMPPATPTPIGTNNQLAQVGNLFELNPASGGPLLDLNGSAVTAGQFQAGWTPVGAVRTETGYEVAWSVLGQNDTVWNTDGNGDYTSNATGVVTGQSFLLEDLNPVFGENLNAALSLSAVLVTAPTGPGGAVNLSGQTQDTTIDLGNNSAFASTGLNVASPAFSGTPAAITLGANADIIEYGLSPSSGIETVTGFVLGADEVNIDLRGAPDSALQFHDITVGGAPAVLIFSNADPAHGLVLLNTGDNSATLQEHTMFIGGHALIR
jgi:serralysin